SGGDVDAVALFEGHDRPLHIRLRTEIAAEHLGLALAHQRVHALHLDVEQFFDGFLDLRLGRLVRDLEQNLVVLGSKRCLFGHDRSDDDVVMARIDILHLKRASSASIAALVSTSFWRRRMSYTLMPWIGSTSMFGILRAAAAKPVWSSAPSMISALVRPRPEKCPTSALVLAASSLADSITIRPPSFAFAESAWRSASARTFFGRSVACERTTGPKARPPPRNCGTRAEP